MITRQQNFSIKDFDIYSNKISLFFNRKTSLGSYFGLTLSFLYCGILISFFIYYTKGVFNKTQLKVYNSVRYPTETPSIKLNNDLFYFAFGAEDETTSVFIDESIYYPEVTYYESVKENNDWSNIVERYLEIEKCNINKFSNRHKLLFKNNSLSTNYCVKNFNNVKLSGSYSYNEISYIKIMLYPCKNSTENNNHCKPQKIIDQYLSSSYISIQMEDIGITTTDYHNPTIPTIKDLYTTIGKSFFKEMSIYYKIVEIENDIGLVTQNIETQKYIQFDKEYDTLYMQKESEYYEGKPLCRVIIQLSDTIDVHNRIYGKMSEVFATTGGYMQFINTIFYIISSIFNYYNMNSTLIDNLFDYNLSQNKLILKHNKNKSDKYEEYKSNILIPSSYFKKKNLTKKKQSSTSLSGNVKCVENPWKSETEVKLNLSSNQEGCDINAININNMNKIICMDRMTGNSSLFALNKLNNLGNILILNKNKNDIKQSGNIMMKKKIINEISNRIDSFRFNFFEYYIYGRCFRNYYKKQFDLYEYGLEVIKNQLDIINVFTANFFFNNLFKRLTKIKDDDEDD